MRPIKSLTLPVITIVFIQFVIAPIGFTSEPLSFNQTNTSIETPITQEQPSLTPPLVEDSNSLFDSSPLTEPTLETNSDSVETSGTPVTQSNAMPAGYPAPGQTQPPASTPDFPPQTPPAMPGFRITNIDHMTAYRMRVTYSMNKTTPINTSDYDETTGKTTDTDGTENIQETLIIDYLADKSSGAWQWNQIGMVDLKITTTDTESTVTLKSGATFSASADKKTYTQHYQWFLDGQGRKVEDYYDMLKVDRTKTDGEGRVIEKEDTSVMGNLSGVREETRRGYIEKFGYDRNGQQNLHDKTLWGTRKEIYHYDSKLNANLGTTETTRKEIIDRATGSVIARYELEVINDAQNGTGQKTYNEWTKEGGTVYDFYSNVLDPVTNIIDYQRKYIRNGRTSYAHKVFNRNTNRLVELEYNNPPANYVYWNDTMSGYPSWTMENNVNSFLGAFNHSITVPGNI
jgi:hypothetical protein